MNKKMIITIVGIACVLAIGFGFYLSMPKTLDVPPSDNKTNSKTANPVKEYEEKEEPVSSDKQEVDNELEKIGSVDKEKQKSIEGFSNEDIKEATEFVSAFAQSTHTNQYFLGGDWAKSGAKVDDLKSFLSAYYSKKVLDELDEFEGKQGTEDFANKMTMLVPFFDDSLNYSPSESCSFADEEMSSEENLSDITCASDLQVSEIKFNPIKNGNGYDLRAEFTVKAKLALYSKELGKDAFVTSEYKYELRLTPTAVDSGNGNWEITGYTISPYLSNIQEWK